MRLARPVLFLLLLGWLSGCASTAGAPAPAAALESDRLQRRFAAGELVQLLREEGYGTVEALEDDGVRFKAGGMSYVLTIYDDGDLQLYFGLTGIAVSQQVVNEWNRTRRLTRAYLDSELDPVLEADLLSDSGLRDRLGAAARRKMETEDDIDQRILALEGHYDEVIEAHRARPS